MKDTKAGSEAVQPAPRDGQVQLSVAPDGLSVMARVIPPERGGQPVSEAAVDAALAEARIVFGIDREAIQKLVQLAAEGRRLDREGIVIASGRPPVDGQDGAVVHHPLLQTPAGYPRLLEDGRADFFHLNMVRNVSKDLVLATRRPPTRGQPGCDVYGHEVKARDGRDVRLRAGKGTKLSADGQSVIATVEGHAAISSGGEVTVSPIFNVPGDVGYATGNIEFVGTVIIRGDVTQGFAVKAGQNVEVHGGIMGGSVEAGGDVIVRYGIVGGGRSRIRAGGKVRCRFIEGAEVEAAGEVAVADGILGARVSGDVVRVTGGRGSIIGGRIRATREISAQTIGSAMGVATELQVGVPPATRAELDRCLELLTQVEERFGQAHQSTSYLEALQGRAADRPDPSPHRQSLRLAEQSKRLSGAEREQLAARAAALQAQLDPVPGACVKAFEAVYPGVRIAIGRERYTVVDQSTRSCFVIGEDGSVTLVLAQY